MKNEILKDGLSDRRELGQKHPRGETSKGQRPTCKGESVKTDRGSFKIR